MKRISLACRIDENRCVSWNNNCAIFVNKPQPGYWQCIPFEKKRRRLDLLSAVLLSLEDTNNFLKSFGRALVWKSYSRMRSGVPKELLLALAINSKMRTGCEYGGVNRRDWGNKYYTSEENVYIHSLILAVALPLFENSATKSQIEVWLLSWISRICRHFCPDAIDRQLHVSGNTPSPGLCTYMICWDEEYQPYQTIWLRYLRRHFLVIGNIDFFHSQSSTVARDYPTVRPHWTYQFEQRVECAWPFVPCRSHYER